MAQRYGDPCQDSGVSDVVASLDDAPAGRSPLVVLDRLEAFLDGSGLGALPPQLYGRLAALALV